MEQPSSSSSSSSSSIAAAVAETAAAQGGVVVKVEQQQRSPIFEASIVQHPIHAKALGFRQLYGSFVDPPLIIVIPFTNVKAGRLEMMRDTRYLCHLRLTNAETKEDCTTLDMVESSSKTQTSSPQKLEDRQEVFNSPALSSNAIMGSGGAPGGSLALQDNMSGSRGMNGRILIDPSDGIEKLFFVFSEVRIRTIGIYTFVCTLMNMRRLDAIESFTLISNPFKVVSPRDYVGNMKASKLSRSFTLQGVLYMGRSR